MLKFATAVFIDETKEVMDECMKQITMSELKDMDAKSFVLLQKCLKLMDSAMDLTVKQAEQLDEMNDKLDKLLRMRD